MATPPPGDSLLELDRDTGYSYLWDAGFLGQEVTVAVLDSGVDPHDKLLGEQVTASRDFTGRNSPAGGTNGHATRMARHVLTLAPSASIANLKVFPNGKSTRLAVAQAVSRAIDYVIDEIPSPKLVNLSLSLVPRGCPENCEACTAVQRATDAGVICVAAAGNGWGGPVTCPGVSPDAFTVTSLAGTFNDWWEGLTPWQRAWWKHSGGLGQHVGTSLTSASFAATCALILSMAPTLHAKDLKDALLAGRRGELGFFLRGTLEHLVSSGALERDVASRLELSGPPPFFAAWDRYQHLLWLVAQSGEGPTFLLEQLRPATPQELSRLNRRRIMAAIEFVDKWLFQTLKDKQAAAEELMSIIDVVAGCQGLADVPPAVEVFAQQRGLNLGDDRRK